MNPNRCQWMPDEDGTIDLVFIGEDFYVKSHTLISSIYRQEKDGRLTRFDWGFLQLAIKQAGKGTTIHAREATPEELARFEEMLIEIRKDPEGASLVVLLEDMALGRDIHTVGP